MKGDPQAFRKMEEEKVQEIKKYSDEVKDELHALLREGKYQNLVCRGESDLFFCAKEENKSFFDMVNKLKALVNKGGKDYDDKITAGAYARHIKEVKAPVVNVSIPSEDGEYFVKFAVECPAFKSGICLLRNFSYAKKKEAI